MCRNSTPSAAWTEPEEPREQIDATHSDKAAVHPADKARDFAALGP
jgi:hypothetical protein